MVMLMIIIESEGKAERVRVQPMTLNQLTSDRRPLIIWLRYGDAAGLGVGVAGLKLI
jgi:hypothetical protein